MYEAMYGHDRLPYQLEKVFMVLDRSQQEELIVAFVF
jgi:hypothetical protein